VSTNDQTIKEDILANDGSGFKDTVYQSNFENIYPEYILVIEPVL